MNNQIKTILLLASLSGILLLIGNLFGGRSGMTFALIMSMVMNFGAYWFSDKLVLAMHQAKPLGPGDSSGVYEIIEELCQKSKLPMPKVYRVPQWAPNAFATGRNPENAAVAVTDGLLNILNERELRAVLAHELSHIGNRDILVSTITASIASAIMYLANMLQWFAFLGGTRRSDDREGGANPIAMILTIILAPIAASLVQAAVSRTREFMADESGAHISEDPEGLASALLKISDPELSHEVVAHQSAETQAAFAHMYIVNHFSGESLMNLFSTHPPVRERIARLKMIAERN